MRLLTTAEAAAALGVCVETIRRWIRRGDLPARHRSPARRRPSYLVDADAVEAIRKGQLPRETRSQQITTN